MLLALSKVVCFLVFLFIRKRERVCVLIVFFRGVKISGGRELEVERVRARERWVWGVVFYYGKHAGRHNQTKNSTRLNTKFG